MRLVTSGNKVLQSSSRVMTNPTGIVKDSSLVYWYDPSLAASYPGSDKYLYDLSGNNYHATCNVTPTFTGNSFYCNLGDKFESRIYFPLPGRSCGYTYDITITLWMRSSTTDRFLYPLQIVEGTHPLHFSFNVNDSDSGSHYRTMWIYWNTSGNPLSAIPLGVLHPSTGHSDLLDGSWYCYTFRRDVSSADITDHFVNGVKVNTVERYGNQGSSEYWGGVLSIGSCAVYTGEIGASHCYSRPLSDEEILRNYNSEKNHFV